MTSAVARRPRWIAAIAAAAFLLHAANYLYFFVDDEGIPFVYARNLLRGRGLVYSSIEGKVEGYSDFLMVFVDAITYAFVRVAHLPVYDVFAVGELISLPCGALIVWLIARFLQRNYRESTAVAGIVVVVLAGPLAVWSCSSLETAPFALGFAVFTLSLLDKRWGRATAAGLVLTLLRIDAPVYLLAAFAGALVCSTRVERRDMLRHVAIPIMAATTVYHCWRILYFHRLLTTPLEAKVMYKLTGPARAITKSPASNYLARFIQLYGAAFLALAAGGWVLLRRTRRAAGILLTGAVLCAYFATVSDWMFGFRFFVPVIPLIAILTAETVDAAAERRPAAGALATAACVLWTAHVAVVFARSFEEVEQDPTFVGSPSRDPARFFSPWWSAYAALRTRAPQGTLIAYNQAGFVPFMLDADNIDDLGICSRFYAELPTQDVFYTEVGRYSPLTNKDVYSAGLAYLLNRQPEYLIERVDLLQKANAGASGPPDELLGGYYRRLWSDDFNAVYVPTGRDASPFRTDPTRFLENVAHVARLSRAIENGAQIPPQEYAERLAFLHEQRGNVDVERSYSLELKFETGAVPVYEIHIERIRASADATVALTLWTSTGTPLHEERLPLAAHRHSGLHVRLAQPVTAAQATVNVASTAGTPFRLHIDDLRIQGQSPQLARYIAAHVPFTR